MIALTSVERERIAEAAAAAPSVHNTQPWLLSFQYGLATLPGARSGLVEVLSLKGFPQILLRFGRP